MSTVVPALTPLGTNESSHSAVSWAAIIGGAFVASSVSLILLALGSGLGLASISPWARDGVSAEAFGVGAIVWLIVTQVASAALGGYLAGRLRTLWVGVHTHEVFFRDTAHGFLVWAVGAVLSASILASAAGSIVSGATRAGASVVGSVGSAAVEAVGRNADEPVSGNPTDYFADMLMRSESSGAEANDGTAQQELARIVATSLARGEFTSEDRAYMARVVAERTGINPAQAEQRVNSVIIQAQAARARAEQEARAAADAARKVAAAISMWMVIALLAGAFAASLAATFGGKTRDRIALDVADSDPDTRRTPLRNE